MSVFGGPISRSRVAPCQLRIEFERAIHRLTARVDARQKIVRDDGDRKRLINGLEQMVLRHDCELLP
jgi:hypothetical protein